MVPAPYDRGVQVASDNPEVRRLVTVIADAVAANGGMIHPELVVNHDGANLWISLPRSANPYADEHLDKPHSDASALLIIPNELHIPVTNLDWDASDDHLTYRATTDHLSDAQRTILDAMVALFNTVDKVRVIGQAYAQHALGGLGQVGGDAPDAAADGDGPEDPITSDSELLALIREARPGFGRAESNRTPDLPGSSPAHTVVRSRLRSDLGEGDEGPLGYFMPMIDMINHHPYGSRYRRTSDGAWRIDVHHPEATDEIFLRYNRADSMGVALGLGYAETATRFVSSVDCRVLSDGMGEVHVRGVSSQRRRLPAPRLTKTESGWQIAGLVLDPQRLANLRTLLMMPLMSDRPELGAEVHLGVVDDLLQQVIAANAAYYERLLAACTPPFDDAGAGTADPHQRALFAAVSAHQLHLLRRIADHHAALMDA